MDTNTHHPDSRPAIAKRLKRLRKTLKLTQREMADKLGLESQQAYQQYENDKRPLPYEVAQKLGELWGIPMDWTYRGLTPMLPSVYLDALKEPGTEPGAGAQSA